MVDINSSHQVQSHLGAFGDSKESPVDRTFDSPPIPPDQDCIELLTPEATLDVLREPGGDIREWLTYIKDHYSPADHKDVLLLVPCASEKPMCDSNTYRALQETLSRFAEEGRCRMHVVTVSEPMGLIPLEFQDGETFLYDCPGLFGWWVKKNGHDWHKPAQEQCLQILGDHIAGFLRRAVENEWYTDQIACVRHTTAYGNEGGDQTHRQMLEHAEGTTDVDLDLTWLPTEETVLELTDDVGPMAWQMTGIAHEAVQDELAAELLTVLTES